jgi:hypothetical protein
MKVFMSLFSPLALLCTFAGSVHASVLYENQGISLEVDDASSNTSDPVLSDTLRLVGRGIQNRSTQDSIALACIGPENPQTLARSCTKVRYVYFRSIDKTTTYFGKTISVKSLDGEPTEADLKALLSKMKKEFKAYLSEKHHTGVKRGVGAMAIGIAGVYTISAATLLIAAPAGAAALICLIISDRPVLSGASDNTSAISNRDGWSWSARPKSISDRRFLELKNYIEQY